MTNNIKLTGLIIIELLLGFSFIFSGIYFIIKQDTIASLSLLIGILLIICSTGIILKKNWSKITSILLGLFSMLIISYQFYIGRAGLLAIIIFILSFYLFLSFIFSNKVKEFYFSK